MRIFCFLLFFLSTGFTASPRAAFNDTQKASAASRVSLHLVIQPAPQEDLSQPIATNFGIAGADIRQQYSQVNTASRDAQGNNFSSHIRRPILSRCSAAVEMFGNNHLSYNYPFHNFW